MDEDAKNFRELMALLQSPRDPADTKRKENLEAAFKNRQKHLTGWQTL